MIKKTAFILLIISPVIGELVIGSIPISQIRAFVPAIGLYEAGAILIRELKVRFQLPLISVVLLGCAFGIAEEGLALRSFFNPKAFNIDLSFGRIIDNTSLSPVLIQLSGLALVPCLLLFGNRSNAFAGLLAAMCFGALVLSESKTIDRIGQAIISIALAIAIRFVKS